MREKRSIGNMILQGDVTLAEIIASLEFLAGESSWARAR